MAPDLLTVQEEFFSAQWNLTQAVGLGCTVKNREKGRSLSRLAFLFVWRIFFWTPQRFQSDTLCVVNVGGPRLGIRRVLGSGDIWRMPSWVALCGGNQGEFQRLPKTFYVTILQSSKFRKAHLPPFNCYPRSQSGVPLLTNIPAGSCWACWEGKHSLHAPSTMDILLFLAFPTGLDSRND